MSDELTGSWWVTDPDKFYARARAKFPETTAGSVDRSKVFIGGPNDRPLPIRVEQSKRVEGRA